MKHPRAYLGFVCWAALFLGVLRAKELPGTSDITPVLLRCEYRTNPIGIDELRPRLSWICQAVAPLRRGLSQSAYQVIVATTPSLLAAGRGDVWDSGKVVTDQSVQIEYAGPPLASRMSYYWQVRIFDQNNRPSRWSAVASWITGLLSPSDWKAAWITWQPAPLAGAQPDPHGSVSPWFRKTFDLAVPPEKALIFVNVVGYEELYVNGRKVGEDVLTPAVSDYSARSFYVTYDITSYLRKGSNCIGLWLGRGWYDPDAGYKDPSRGPGPRARIQCEITVDGTAAMIVSDATWKAAASPYTTIGLYQWNEYHGEHYDANLENPHWNLASLDDRLWENVRVANSPAPRSEAQPCPLNRIREHFAPVAIKDLGQRRYELDFGTDLTGGLEYHLPLLAKGAVIIFHYADEKRNAVSDRGTVPEGLREVAKGSYKELVFTGKDGVPNAYQSMRQYDEFVSSGAPRETFRTKFNYHGFRYVVIENLPSAPAKTDAEATLIESDLDTVGSFSCSNELFNRINAVNTWTLRCLNLGGYLADCPHRERLGYGDHHVSVETNVMNLWMPAFYAKWIRDWRDTQDPKTGMLPHSAPQRAGAGGPVWGGTLQALTWRQYLYYGDRRILADNYDACRRYADALEAHCKDGVLRAYGTYWDFIGEWVAPRLGMDTANYPPATPVAEEFFNNCYRVYLWAQLAQMATTLDRKDEALYCRTKVDTIRPLIHAAFYDARGKKYVRDQQTYLVMALMTGVVPDALRATMLDALENDILIKNNGHLDTGIWGTYFLIQYCQDIGRNDLIYTVMNQTTYPGWGYMLSQGATTLWEQWNGFYSRIHSCFTSAGGWFYQGLAGIRIDEQAPGFKNVIIKPAMVGDLKWVKARHLSAYGAIESSWSVSGQRVLMRVVIPPNATATVYVPTADPATVLEGGRIIKGGAGVKLLRREPGYAVYAVGSGDYAFSSFK